jgi:hypothetical protein
VKVPLAVTTTGKAPGHYEGQARARAAVWGVPFLSRPRKTPIERLLAEAEALLVLGGKGWVLADALGTFGYSPGVGALRLKRFDAGQGAADVLVRLAELQPGDVVVDGTLGLAADALVCARAAGPTGRVIGVEASLAVYALVSEGIASDTRSAPLELRHGRAAEVLRALGPRSVDVVTLDPMFDRPRKAAPGFEVLRRHAVHAPLDEETIVAARRAARRWVVIKAARYGREFERLGLSETRVQRAAPVRWARLPPLAP